jgi:hypothetical protein
MKRTPKTGVIAGILTWLWFVRCDRSSEAQRSLMLEAKSSILDYTSDRRNKPIGFQRVAKASSKACIWQFGSLVENVQVLV